VRDDRPRRRSSRRCGSPTHQIARGGGETAGKLEQFKAPRYRRIMLKQGARRDLTKVVRHSGSGLAGAHVRRNVFLRYPGFAHKSTSRQNTRTLGALMRGSDINGDCPEKRRRSATRAAGPLPRITENNGWKETWSRSQRNWTPSNGSSLRTGKMGKRDARLRR